MKIGIVGLPNVGKSTLFNAMTKAGALAANYPFATIEPNIGIVKIPDERVDYLAKFYNAKSVIHATIEFVDIAGLVKGASKGEGLGNKFLAKIREVDAIVHVVRAFQNNDIVHVDGSVNPLRDIETINIELGLADLEAKERRDAKGKGTGDIQMLLDKPTVYCVNTDDKGSAGAATSVFASLRRPTQDVTVVSLCAKLEEELAMLDNDDDRRELMEMYGLQESGLDKLARAAYQKLGLISFLTAGEQEVRAWTVKKGAKAPQAAGRIHTDFEKGFIRAEVISYADFVECGGMVKAKEKGKVRIEGKDYVVVDGDIIHFRFNV